MDFSGYWLFEPEKELGLAFNDDEPKVYTFNGARDEIVKKIVEWTGISHEPINLVIEAPLSVCFSKDGNPKPRTIEAEAVKDKTGKEKMLTRYWYMGAGCAVMTAALFLIRDIHKEFDKTKTRIRLFEGFISYKENGQSPENKRQQKSKPKLNPHERDVCLLRELVEDPHAFDRKDCIYGSHRLANKGDSLTSTLTFVGFEGCGVPLVLKRRHDASLKNPKRCHGKIVGVLQDD